MFMCNFVPRPAEASREGGPRPSRDFSPLGRFFVHLLITMGAGDVNKIALLFRVKMRYTSQQ